MSFCSVSNVLAILLFWNSCPNDQKRPAASRVKEKTRDWMKLWGLQTSYVIATRLEAEQGLGNRRRARCGGTVGCNANAWPLQEGHFNTYEALHIQGREIRKEQLSIWLESIWLPRDPEVSYATQKRLTIGGAMTFSPKYFFPLIAMKLASLIDMILVINFCEENFLKKWSEGTQILEKPLKKFVLLVTGLVTQP